MKSLNLPLRNVNVWEENYLIVIVMILFLNCQFIVLRMRMNPITIALAVRTQVMDMCGKIS